MHDICWNLWAVSPVVVIHVKIVIYSDSQYEHDQPRNISCHGTMHTTLMITGWISSGNMINFDQIRTSPCISLSPKVKMGVTNDFCVPNDTQNMWVIPRYFDKFLSKMNTLSLISKSAFKFGFWGQLKPRADATFSFREPTAQEKKQFGTEENIFILSWSSIIAKNI